VPKVPSRSLAFCYDAKGKVSAKTLKAMPSGSLCGLSYQMGNEYFIWSAMTSYTNSPCSGDNVGRIWAGAPHQGCRRGASYVRSSPPFLPSDAPASCRAIKAGNPKAKSGPAWVKPLPNMHPVKVWCDQDFDGGGWTLISQARAAPSINPEAATLCQRNAIGKLDTSNAYNMASPTAKLSDKMINGLLNENLPHSAISSSPEVLLAAHYHDSSHANPPANMNQPWGQRCIVPFDGKVSWNSANKGSKLPNPPKGRKGRCYSKKGSWQSDLTKYASGNMCGLGYTLKEKGATRYILWTADTTYKHAPCNGDSIGRIWVGAPNQGCRRGKTYVRSKKP